MMRTNKDLSIKIQDGTEQDLVDQKKRQEITHAKIEEISSEVKALREATKEILAIKIERREKRDLIEERKHKVTDDMATCLKEISVATLKSGHFKSRSSHVEQDDTNFLKICQSLLSDFIFFMLALLPWILYNNNNSSNNNNNNKESPTKEYYALLFFVTALAFLGMTGYVLSHIARTGFWIKITYFITAIAVMSTIALVGYTLFSLIPNDYEHHEGVMWIYLGVYAGIGFFPAMGLDLELLLSRILDAHSPKCVRAPML